VHDDAKLIRAFSTNLYGAAQKKVARSGILCQILKLLQDTSCLMPGTGNRG